MLDGSVRPGLAGLVALTLATAACSGGGYITEPAFDAGGRPVPAEDGGSGNNYGASAAATPPPPLSGGTLAVDSAAGLAVAADPDRDRVYVTNLRAADLASERPRVVQLEPGDEPGRVALDGAGHAFVALRRGGALVTVDLARAAVSERRAVCPVPRGVAVEPGRVYVACASGELMALPAQGGTPAWSTLLEPDLRDVVIDGDHLMVSTFRRAQVRWVDKASGQPVGAATSLPVIHSANARGEMVSFEPEVAWRMIPYPGVGALMVHQRAQVSSVAAFGDDTNGGAPQYGGGGGCQSGVVHGAVTAVGEGQVPATPILVAAVLPVDVAVSPDGQRIAVVAAGNMADTLPKVVFADKSAATVVDGASTFGCAGLPGPGDSTQPGTAGPTAQPEGRAVAVAFDGNRVLVQTREPAALQYLDDGAFVNLVSPGDATAQSALDTGYEIFHDNASPMSNMACASCHPEGGDDGHVWQLAEGPRRTQNFRGGFMATAPFHWDGAFDDLSHLMTTVFNGRMAGDPLSAQQVGYLERWLQNVPALPPPAVRDAAAVARGQAIFADPVRACATCHAGERLTNNQTVNIGLAADTTGDRRSNFQVPSLRGLAYRAPYMHTGCAATLRDRFDPACGGSAHGNLDGLTEADKDDLVAYLNTL